MRTRASLPASQRAQADGQNSPKSTRARRDFRTYPRAREFPDADRRTAEQRGRERLARATASVRRWAGVGAGAVVRQASPGRAAPPGNGGGAPPPDDDRLEQLERLGRLHDSGTLDDDEFRAEKHRILSAAAL
jgi:hypothetical protein